MMALMGWQTNQNLHEQGMLINRDAIPTNTEWRIVKSPTLGGGGNKLIILLISMR